MIVEQSIRKDVMTFCELNYGDVFTFAKNDSGKIVYFIVVRCDSTGSYNAAYLSDGWLTKIEEDTPVYKVDGKFIIEE